MTHRPLLARTIVATIAATVIAYGAAWWARDLANDVDARSAERGRDRQTEIVRTCQRGNIERGLELLDAPTPQALRRREATNPLVDCRDTVLREHGTTVPMPPARAERYLTVLASNRIPE